MYLHFVNPRDNSIMEVDAVLALIDKNSDYLDELYKEFNVLLSEVGAPSAPALASRPAARALAPSVRVIYHSIPGFV